MRSLRFILIVCAFVAATTAMAQSLSGTYRLVQDSTGKQPKDRANLDIVFKPGGTFTFKAVMPGQTVDDTGTYRISGQTLTIDFKDLEQGHQSGPYSLSGETLTLPFKMLSAGAGSSTWRLVAGAPSSGVPSAAGSASAAASPIAEILARTLKDAQGSDNARQRSEVDQRSAARSGAYAGGAGQAYYVQGSIFFFKRYYKEAWYSYAKAASLAPQNAAYLNNLAMVLLELGRLQDARGILDWVVKGYPNVAPPWGNLGAACLKLRDTACAAAAFQRALAIAPGNGLYAYGYGKALDAQGKSGEARGYYAQAFQKGYSGSGKEGASAADASGGTGAGAAGAATATAVPGRSRPGSAETGRKDRIPEAWVGRYQARYVRATSGMDGDSKTAFGKGMTQTTLNLQTMACVQQFSMDIAASGVIEGRGRIMYVYQGTSANPAAMLAAGMPAAGGFAANLKDGKQFRDWTFSGRVSPDGSVEIHGIPGEPMDMLNVGKWEKRKPWSALPPDGPGASMRGPFHMTLASERGGPPAIRVEQFLALGDALIKRVHYQAYIFKSDSPVTPDCKAAARAKAKCAASEYLKTKVTIGVDGVGTVESSRDVQKDLKLSDQTDTAKVGGKVGVDAGGNMNIEGGWGAIIGSAQFNPTDGSYQFTMGTGVETPGPVKLSEKIEVVYDSACGWGVKATAGASAGAGASTGSAGGSVEGMIYFNKGI